MASSNMVKYLRISTYIRKPFLIYDFAPDPIRISSHMRAILFSFLSVFTVLRSSPPIDSQVSFLERNKVHSIGEAQGSVILPVFWLQSQTSGLRNTFGNRGASMYILFRWIVINISSLTNIDIEYIFIVSSFVFKSIKRGETKQFL